MRAFCHVWVTSESERVGNLAWQLRCMCWLVRQMYEGVRAKDHAEVDRPATAMHALFTRLPDTRARGEIVVYAVCKQVCGGR